jgi:SAM-dependent methyltransferase
MALSSVLREHLGWGQPDRKLRETLLAITPRDLRILEIGAGYAPFYRKRDFARAENLDHAAAEALAEKYRGDPAVAHLLGDIQKVDYVWNGGPITALIPKGRKFDLIFSSHNIEHQTDFIEHLDNIAELLADGAEAVFLIPHKFRTFDMFRPVSTTGDFVLAHGESRVRHLGKQLIDSALATTFNPGREMSVADLDRIDFAGPLAESYARATAARNDAAQPYFDCHAWIFTEGSFQIAMIELYMLGLTRMLPSFVSGPSDNEFLCCLAPVPPFDPSRADLARELNELRKRLYIELYLGDLLRLQERETYFRRRRRRLVSSIRKRTGWLRAKQSPEPAPPPASIGDRPELASILRNWTAAYAGGAISRTGSLPSQPSAA